MPFWRPKERIPETFGMATSCHARSRTPLRERDAGPALVATLSNPR